jgi:hypothetical protein
MADPPQTRSSAISTVSFEPVPPHKTRTFPLSTLTGKGRSRWKLKLGRFEKDSSQTSGDTTSLSSTILESQQLEEIPLKNLACSTKNSIRGKNTKNINVYLSQNSTTALFWTQSLIHIWEVGTSPPTMSRPISTESTCVLAAVTKTFLAYIMGTRDQKLTVKYLSKISEASFLLILML